jgi:hypothetical protein
MLKEMQKERSRERAKGEKDRFKRERCTERESGEGK